jgi:hypothetical protein
MTDSSSQSDSQSNDLIVSDLYQRLVKRATEPMGVIDVRYGQQKYYRIAQWLTGRSSLFADLMKRYAVEEATAYGEHPLAVQRALDQTGNLFSTTSQSFSPVPQPEAKTFTAPLDAHHQAEWDTKPSGLAEILAEHSSKSDTKQPVSQPPATAESKFRISRQPPPMLPKADAITPTRKLTSDIPLPSKVQTGTIALPAGSLPTAGQSPGEVRINETRVHHEVQVKETPIHETRVNTDPGATQTADFVFRKSHLEISEEKKTDVPPGISQQEKSVGAQEKLVNMQEKAISAQEKSTHLQEKPASLPTNSEPTGATLTTAQQGTRAPSAILPVAALPALKPPTTPRHSELVLPVQNKEDGRQSQAGNAATQKSIFNAEPSGLNSGAAMATEIRADSINREMPDIIWRKPAGDLQSTSVAPAQSSASSISGIAGSTHDAPALTAQQSAQADSPVRVQTERPQVQVEQVSPQVIRAISEQVMRTITLDLKLERERRGVTKWR